MRDSMKVFVIGLLVVLEKFWLRRRLKSLGRQIEAMEDYIEECRDRCRSGSWLGNFFDGVEPISAEQMDRLITRLAEAERDRNEVRYRLRRLGEPLAA